MEGLGPRYTTITMAEVSKDKAGLPAELPEFTFKNVMQDIYNGISAIFVNPAALKAVLPVVVCFSSIACKVIISKVSYTEIDFSTYMQQIDMVNDGALDYSVIHGDSGPIVYPAGFVQVYQALHWLTDGGADLRLGQLAFGYLFSLTILLTCVVYIMAGGVPPWTLFLLVASKRLYSIYVLRLFNDCFTTVGILAVIMVLQQAAFWSNVLSDSMMFMMCAVATDVYSMALSVKMNVLLYLPALVVVLFFLLGERPLRLAAVLTIIPLVQVLVGWRFLLPLFWDEEASHLRRTYLTHAFDFSRKFLYEWTVNWRFVPEHVFDSPTFANSLLALHVVVLLVFTVTRFCNKSLTQKPLKQLVIDAFAHPTSKTVSPDNLLLGRERGPKLVLLIFAVTNLIGVLFARSLHYQFLSWYCWLVPFLLHMAGYNIFTGAAVAMAHEWCWNVFPSTKQSSLLLVTILLSTLALVWWNTDAWFCATPADVEQTKEKKTQ